MRAILVLILAACTMSRPLNSSAAEIVKTTVAYREVDGHRILADVYRPPGEEVCPVIVWIHGGGLIMGHREGIHRRVRTVAERHGFALVSIDYRLAPETRLPELIRDVEVAFEWLANRAATEFHLDPERLAVCGGSAGGYLTLVTGYRVRPRPQALVSLYGYGQLTGDWYTKPSPHPRHHPRPVTREEATAQTDGRIVSDARQRRGDGGLIYLHYRQHGLWPLKVSGFPPDRLRKLIAPYEPLRNVTGDFPPTLFLHGTNDTDVPFEESVRMAEELKRHNVRAVLKPIEQGEHGFGGGDPVEIENAYAAMEQFIVQAIAVPEP